MSRDADYNQLAKRQLTDYRLVRNVQVNSSKFISSQFKNPSQEQSIPNFTANFTFFHPHAPSQKCKGIPVGTGSSRAQWSYSLKQCHSPVCPPQLTRSLVTPCIQKILILSFFSEWSPSKYQTVVTPLHEPVSPQLLEVRFFLHILLHSFSCLP